MTYDNIKSHKEPGFPPLFRRYIFRKTTCGGIKLNLPAVLRLSSSHETKRILIEIV